MRPRSVYCTCIVELVPRRNGRRAEWLVVLFWQIIIHRRARKTDSTGSFPSSTIAKEIDFELSIRGAANRGKMSSIRSPRWTRQTFCIQGVHTGTVWKKSRLFGPTMSILHEDTIFRIDVDRKLENRFAEQLTGDKSIYRCKRIDDL